jgi:hypothetical protein
LLTPPTDDELSVLRFLKQLTLQARLTAFVLILRVRIGQLIHELVDILNNVDEIER